MIEREQKIEGACERRKERERLGIAVHLHSHTKFLSYVLSPIFAINRAVYAVPISVLIFS